MNKIKGISKAGLSAVEIPFLFSLNSFDLLEKIGCSHFVFNNENVFVSDIMDFFINDTCSALLGVTMICNIKDRIPFFNL